METTSAIALVRDFFARRSRCLSRRRYLSLRESEARKHSMIQANSFTSYTPCPFIVPPSVFCSHMALFSVRHASSWSDIAINAYIDRRHNMAPFCKASLHAWLGALFSSFFFLLKAQATAPRQNTPAMQPPTVAPMMMPVLLLLASSLSSAFCTTL